MPQRHGIRYLAGAEGQLLDVKAYFNGGEGLFVDQDCFGSMARMEVRDNAEGNIISLAPARRFVAS